MPLLSKNIRNQNISFTVKLLLFLVLIPILLMPEIIFQKSAIFDEVKLISDVQRYSINYSESHFECQNASRIFKKIEQL